MSARLRHDAGTSPVIGVILLVAMTVVMAALVYTWSTSFANVSTQGVHVVGLVGDQPSNGTLKNYTVSASMPGMRYVDVGLNLDGVELRMGEGEGCPDPAPGEFVVCRAGVTRGPLEPILAGDAVKVHAEPGQTLRVIDRHGGAVVLSQRVT